MKRITKVLALAATATAMSFGATAAWANLIGLGSITGCMAVGATSVDNCSGNAFSTATADGTLSASFNNAAGTPVFFVTADFGTNASGDDIFTLTFKNDAKAAVGLNAGTVMFFGNIDFGASEYLAALTGATMTSSTRGDLTSALGQVFDIPAGGKEKGALVGPTGDSFMLDFNDAAPKVQSGELVTITAKLVRAPEPGSLALLGALLVAFGAIRIGRARSFAWRAGKLAS